jgi:hypothetical protein
MAGRQAPGFCWQGGQGGVVGQLEPQVLIELDLALRGWLELP